MSVEAELIALLKASQPGQRLIHLHFSRTPPSAEQRQAIRQKLRELGRKADAWRLFDVASGDLLMLFQGAPDELVQAACRHVGEVLPGVACDVLADPKAALPRIEKI